MVDWQLLRADLHIRRRTCVHRLRHFDQGDQESSKSDSLRLPSSAFAVVGCGLKAEAVSSFRAEKAGECRRMNIPFDRSTFWWDEQFEAG